MKTQNRATAARFICISGPCCAPAFSFGGLRLWWAIFPCESASVGAGDVVGATEPEPELEDAQEAAVVAQHQRLATMEAHISSASEETFPLLGFSVRSWMVGWKRSLAKQREEVVTGGDQVS